MIKNIRGLLSDLADAFTAHKLEKRALERRLLKVIAAEVNENKLDKAVWLKAFSDAEGDKERAKALYIKHRLSWLKDQVTSLKIKVKDDHQWHEDLQGRGRKASEGGLQRAKIVTQTVVQEGKKTTATTYWYAMGIFAGALAFCVVIVLISAIDAAPSDAMDSTSIATFDTTGANTYSTEPVAAMPTPSFDCQDVSSFAELLICGDQELAASDAAMARIYHARLDSSDSFTQRELRKTQLEWLDRRNACATRECVTNAYDQWPENADASEHHLGSTPAISGVTAPPIIDDQWSIYRTKIIEDWNTDPTLDGRYVIIRTGCGTGCTFNFVGDHLTGRLYGLGLGGEDMQELELKYDDSSSAVHAQWEDLATDTCQRQSFRWTGVDLIATNDVVSSPRQNWGCPPQG